ncbi:MAG: hypothetical protein KJ729_00050 [Euryarchaeota archaeon]|nr:hypothetical protein [Euryarchaeota archaeon]
MKAITVVSISSVYFSEKTKDEFGKASINMQTNPKKYGKMSEPAFMKISMS